MKTKTRKTMKNMKTGADIKFTHKNILTDQELEEVKKEAVKQYKLILFQEIDYYLNNMMAAHYEGIESYSSEDVRGMINNMEQREF